MASYKNLRTYQRKDRNVTATSASKSVEVINDLFAKNISKRIATKKSPLKIQELPPRTEGYAQSSDSIHISAEDTFDKLVAGPKYNAVKITDSFHKIATTSESDVSLTKPRGIHITHKIHKPILKRQRRRKPKATLVEVADPASPPTPPLPPLVIDTVFPELSVEPAQNHLDQVSLEHSISVEGNNTIFSESFRQTIAQKPGIPSSTPVVRAARKNIQPNAISPIEKVSFIEKSYDVIKNWDSSYPQMETPTNSLPKFVAKRRKSKGAYKSNGDWKLKCQPKVYLNRLKPTPAAKVHTVKEEIHDEVHTLEESPLRPVVESDSDDEEHSYALQPGKSPIPPVPVVNQTPHIPIQIKYESDSDDCLEVQESIISLDDTWMSQIVATKTDPNNLIKRRQRKQSFDLVEEDCVEIETVPIYGREHLQHSDEQQQQQSQEQQQTQQQQQQQQQLERTPEKRIEKRVEQRTKQFIDIFHDHSYSASPVLAKLPKEVVKKRPEKKATKQAKTVKGHQSPVVVKAHQGLVVKDLQGLVVKELQGSVVKAPQGLVVKDLQGLVVKDLQGLVVKEPQSSVVKGHQSSAAVRAKQKPKQKEIVEVASEPPSTIALSSMFEPSGVDEIFDLEEAEERVRQTLAVAPGKKYRRSLAHMVAKSICTGERDCVCLICARKHNTYAPRPRQSTVRIVPAPKNDFSRKSILQAYAEGYAIKEEPDRTADLEDSVRGLSLIHSSLDDSSCLLTGDVPYDPENLTARDIILQRCNQREPLPFDECYPSSLLEHCQKIGEGVYGEVFLYKNPNGGTTVMKVIPIEGSQIINGEHQKKFSDILSEVVITMELSNLKKTGRNMSSCFCQVRQVKCVQGRYPDRLIELWDIYDENRGSENDSPLTFNSQQMYIILELVNGGSDMEAFSFNNALQAYSMFRQLATALAVAESQLKFEHRDLHWGNVLINEVDKNKVIDFCLNGEDIQFISYGVELCVIDFTLSRIEHDGVVIYLDLSQDHELFMAKGDYQFDIYRLMQENNENEWEHFEAFSNVLWLHYVLDKCVSHLRYKNTKSKTHKDFLDKLKMLKDTILKHRSAQSFVTETLMRKK